MGLDALMTDEQRQKINKIFDDLHKAAVPPIKAASVLGCTVKAAKKGLARALARAEARTPAPGRTMMNAVLQRGDGWHSIDLEHAHLTAFARSDSPSRLPFRPRETDP